ncbi:MAG: hypothetical protein H9W81_03325 [Enterococcus sp.]|nr:hypothetical protein [Enterococcus sp.]
MRYGTKNVKAWVVRLLIAAILAFTGVWAEVSINGALNRTPETTYKVKIHHIERTGDGDCSIVPVVKKKSNPEFIYHGLEACNTLKKGDYVKLPDPAKFPPDE